MLGAWFAEQLLLTIFANALYWRHINGLIRDVPRSIADKPDRRMRRLERDGGTSIGATLGILFGVGIIGIGMVAAIAIPAYQDYTIRAQVTEGLGLAAEAKAAVVEYYAQKNEWPLDAESAGLRPIGGKYVEAVTVANGSIVITYGGMANRNIANARLVLTPGITARGDVVWICGEQKAPAEIVQMGSGPQGSNVAQRYLPKQCRPAAGT
jgi:type IV pilus assembly protein PilA